MYGRHRQIDYHLAVIPFFPGTDVSRKAHSWSR